MKKFLAITPYFGGTSSAPRQTELDNVARYFEKMCESIEPYMIKLIVAVSSEKDYEAVEPFARYPDQRVEIMRISGIDPIFLPANMVRIVQQWDISEEYIYFTESDQVFYAKDVDNLFRTIDENHNVYIVPQRFEQSPPESYRLRKLAFPGSTDERFVDFEGQCRENNNEYVVANEPGSDPYQIGTVEKVYDYDDYFYVNPSPTQDLIDAPEYYQAYGAAFLCHQDLFKRVKFIDSKYEVPAELMNQHDPDKASGRERETAVLEFQPTETTAGHDLLRTKGSVCLKSKNLFYFHVDHLSGYEFNKKL